MKERAKKRLFIAVDISDEAREAATEYVHRFKNDWPDPRIRISWTRPQNLHLTLKFLGDVEEERLAELTDAIHIAAASVSNFQIEISGTGVFQSERKPKVLWIGVVDSGGNLKSAAREIEKNCAEIGFAKDERDFSPHLTIGRVRDPRSARELAGAHIRHEFGPVLFDVGRIVLYESELATGGSVYTPLIQVELAG